MTDRVRRAIVAVGAAPGRRIELDAEESHHVSRVLRLKRGDALCVFDGAGREWTATIEELARHHVAVVVGDELTERVESTLRLVVFQALIRPEKLEWVLQKGTELGVAAFRLFASDRVDAPPPSEARLTRYRRILLESCKQSGRRMVPELSVGPLDAPGPGIVAVALAPVPEAARLGQVLAAPAPAAAWLAVGPEGGFTADERGAWQARGWLLASLGPRVLRTETAGAVAAAIVLNKWGDLGPI
jgi:16S rRNA (uracil1498-N3)-methyltransferase